MAEMSSETVTILKERIDAFTADPEGIPGVVYCAVNRNGDLLFEHASGKVGIGQEKNVDMNTVFWIASCTKMITGIACMQLVEQGKLELDSVDLVEKLAPASRPELKVVKVLEEGGEACGQEARNHAAHAAFSYCPFNRKLNDFYGPTGLDELSGLAVDYLSQPLVNQPGHRWEYGINVDWAGQLVERVMGMSLNDYFIKYIFAPMGIQNITMFPTEQMKKDLVFLNDRDPQGRLSLHADGHINRRPLVVTKAEDIKATFNSGGAGCFARPSEYCQIIAMLLNNGTHAKTGNQILSPETVKEMFTNQIKDMPDFGRQGIDSAKRHLSNPIPELYPQPPEQAQGWGLTFFLHVHPGPTGRSGSTGWWGGVPNLFWWTDREKGLGGIIASQIIPFGDAKVLGLWAEVEAGLYKGLIGPAAESD